MQAVTLKNALQSTEINPPPTDSGPDFWSAAGTILAQQRQIPPIQHHSSGTSNRLSPAQERLWLLEQSEGGAPYYNVNLAWQISGDLDVSTLESSLDYLCQRHQILRTTFPSTPQGPVQSINNWRFHLPVMELRAGSGELTGRANEFIRREFDLADGPLFRAALLRESRLCSTLVVVVHQIIFDGASMRVFSQELHDCYRAFSQNKKPELPALPVTYLEFAAWQHECIALSKGDQEFWRTQFERSYKPLKLPADRPRQNVGITPGALASFWLPEGLIAPLRLIGAEHGVSAFAAFLAVFQSFLGRLTGQDDVLSLVSIAARNQADLRNLVGLVANVLPMRLDLSGRPSLRTTLQRSGHVVSSALCHQMFPLSSILEMLPSSGADEDAPMLQTFVIYNNGSLPVLQFEKVAFSPLLEFDNGTSRFDLVVDASDSPQGIIGTLKYRTDLFEPQRIRALLDDWKEFIRQATEHPDRELAAISPTGTYNVAQPETYVHSTLRRASKTPEVDPNPLNASPSHRTPGLGLQPDYPRAPLYSCAPSSRSPGTIQKTPPRTELERALAKIWQEIFGISSVGVHDNFFGLGGHSLVAVRIIAAIEKATGWKLRLCKIFQEPTIARLASAIESEGAAASSSIVEIQPEGSRPPLFLVHGVGGGMFWGYSNLARELGSDQPVYAFKSRGMDGLEEFRSIEEMAAHYVADLRKFQPSGPYCLGGYCFGGNVAYEMARQLRQQDQEIAVLFLMNCWPNNSSYTRLRFTPFFFAKAFWNFCIRLAYQIRSNAGQPRDFFKWRAAWLRKRMKSFFAPQTAKGLAVEDIVDLSSRPEHERKLWRTHVEAWLEYQPLPYDGEVVLFRTRGHPLVCSYDKRMGWSGYAKGGVLVRVCPGDHESILEEQNVAATAAKLKKILNGLNRAPPPVAQAPPKEAASLAPPFIEPADSAGAAWSPGI
jgi:thioesterase domain-containing protein/acyl carrier protein